MGIENVTGKRVPPAQALQQKIETVRGLLSPGQRFVAGPLLDTFAAYVASTDEQLRTLARDVEALKRHAPTEAHHRDCTCNRCNGG